MKTKLLKKLRRKALSKYRIIYECDEWSIYYGMDMNLIERLSNHKDVLLLLRKLINISICKMVKDLRSKEKTKWIRWYIKNNW